MTTTLSKTISALRTILCFQIVFLHAAMTGLTNQELSASYDGSYAIYKYLSTALTLTTRTAVPLFFIISGYLFFINYKKAFITTYHNMDYSIFTALLHCPENTLYCQPFLW